MSDFKKLREDLPEHKGFIDELEERYTIFKHIYKILPEMVYESQKALFSSIDLSVHGIESLLDSEYLAQVYASALVNGFKLILHESDETPPLPEHQYKSFAESIVRAVKEGMVNADPNKLLVFKYFVIFFQGYDLHIKNSNGKTIFGNSLNTEFPEFFKNLSPKLMIGVQNKTPEPSVSGSLGIPSSTPGPRTSYGKPKTE